MSQLAQPTPQKISVGQVNVGDQRLVLIQFEGPNGTWFTFLPNEEVRQLANQLLEVSTGLKLATADTPIPPQGQLQLP